jgi:Fe-S-cluster containining protein
MSDDERLGIWGNKECAMCGACCYEHSMMSYDEPCEHQNIINKKSYCGIYESKPGICDAFFCGMLDEPEEIIYRWRLRALSKKLGTSPIEKSSSS